MHPITGIIQPGPRHRPLRHRPTIIPLGQRRVLCLLMSFTHHQRPGRLLLLRHHTASVTHRLLPVAHHQPIPMSPAFRRDLKELIRDLHRDLFKERHQGECQLSDLFQVHQHDAQGLVSDVLTC